MSKLYIIKVLLFGFLLDKPPLHDEFWQIVNEPYVLNVNDCSNKAAKYCMTLLEAGYDAECVVISPTRFGDGYPFHALVKLNNHPNGYPVYYDLTSGGRARYLEFYGFLVYTVSNDRLGKEDEWK